MKIVKYEDTLPFIGYMKMNTRGAVRYYFAELDSGDSGARKISIDDLVVSDLELYKAVYKMSGYSTEIEAIQAYFEYIDIKYPTYSYY